MTGGVGLCAGQRLRTTGKTKHCGRSFMSVFYSNKAALLSRISVFTRTTMNVSKTPAAPGDWSKFRAPRPHTTAAMDWPISGLFAGRHLLVQLIYWLNRTSIAGASSSSPFFPPSSVVDQKLLYILTFTVLSQILHCKQNHYT